MALSYFSLNDRCDNTIPAYLCTIGNISGWISSSIWFIVLFPQIIKNYKEKTVHDISLMWAILNFSASYVNLFFVFQNSFPLFSKISAVYMPILESMLLLQFYFYGIYEIKRKKTCFYFFIFFLLSLTITNIFLSQFYIEYLEWIAIVLWSIETFPQIHLNFKNKSVKGLSKISQFMCFIGKSSDIMQSYFLKIPSQYRYLAFFSSSASYVVNIQVMYYYKEERYTQIEENEEFELVKKEFNYNQSKSSNISIIFLIFCTLLVFSLMIFAAGGFILLTEYLPISISIVVAFYIVILLLYMF